jgi:hypothetical protein
MTANPLGSSTVENLAITHAISKPTRPMTNMIMPSCGETPDIQRAIPIAMKRNPHRWMFFIVPKLIMASRLTSRFHSSKQVQHHSRVFMDFSLFSLRLTRGHGVIFAKTLARGVLP